MLVKKPQVISWTECTFKFKYEKYFSIVANKIAPSKSKAYLCHFVYHTEHSYIKNISWSFVDNIPTVMELYESANNRFAGVIRKQ